jgi:hypothetical protein
MLESTDDHLNTNDDTIKDPVIEKCSFQRNTICLPPDIAFQIYPLSEMNEHRGNDLNMFVCVCVCVCVCSCPPVGGGLPSDAVLTARQIPPPPACNVILLSVTPSASPLGRC